MKCVKGVLKVLISKRKKEGKVVLVHFWHSPQIQDTHSGPDFQQGGLASQVVVMMVSWGLNGFESQGDVRRLQIKEIKTHTSYRFTPKVCTKKI